MELFELMRVIKIYHLIFDTICVCYDVVGAFSKSNQDLIYDHMIFCKYIDSVLRISFGDNGPVRSI